MLSVQAALMLFAGVALFALGDEAADLWPWPLTPLTARAVGAFMAGFGVAAAFAVRDDDLARLRGCALAYAALGALELAAVAIYSDDVDARRRPGCRLFGALGERAGRRRLRFRSLAKRGQRLFGVAITLDQDTLAIPQRPACA